LYSVDECKLRNIHQNTGIADASIWRGQTPHFDTISSGFPLIQKSVLERFLNNDETTLHWRESGMYDFAFSEERSLSGNRSRRLQLRPKNPQYPAGDAPRPFAPGYS
jgi:hypothetical protein